MRPHCAHIVVFTLATLLATGTAFAAEFAIGPIVQRVTERDAVVAFELVEPAAGLELAWGLEGRIENTVELPADASRHEVNLAPLQANREVIWELRQAGVPLAPRQTFRTTDLPGMPFRFLLFGDTRTRHDAHATVVAGMMAVPDARFYVQSGDLVDAAWVPEQWATYFDIEAPLMRRIPIYPVIGNHDEDLDDAPQFRRYFVLPENSPAPEEYYSFEWGNVHVTVLDGHTRNTWPWTMCATLGLLLDDCLAPEQMRWLIDDLRTAAAAPHIDHLIVAVHIGPYSSRVGRSGNAQMRALLPLFHEAGVSLIVSGHDHYYERGYADNGIPYIISGGGGAPLYGVWTPSPQPHTVAYNLSTEHFIVVDVDGPLLHLEARDPAGTVLDSFEVDSTPECETELDCLATPAAVCAPPTQSRTFCSIGSRCVSRCHDPVHGWNPTASGPWIQPNAQPPGSGEEPEGEDLAPELEADTTPEPDLRDRPESPPAEPTRTDSRTGCAATGRESSPSGPGALTALVLAALVRRRPRTLK